ncbi:LPS-assembly protein LptD [Thiosulfatimonas sediminis]|uniref:LPS-assembly protein LptD n=1 Tax=Thiosulfatimonas sediminis TaxID=2675054 RepID=A0A6F8PTN3_9GAMM|nr:LPS assembly protein LptD [Thiosulfatimonas sediminis]BBP45368.1 LPS-assembly protein LptD [Thiosulfatimonas sediminis]
MRKNYRLRQALYYAVTCLGTNSVLAAAPNPTEMTFTQTCLPDEIATRPDGLFEPSDAQLSTDLQNAPLKISADRLSQTRTQEISLQGAVQLQHPQVTIRAEQLEINPQTRQAHLKHGVRLWQQNLTLLTEDIQINPPLLSVAANQYQIFPSLAYGQSQSIRLNQSTQSVELYDASLTTCKTKSDGTKDWDLQARKLQINQQKQRVIAKDMTLRFKNVPIFYSPYLDYPLNDRASGLLFPEIGSYKALNNNKRTEYVALPYYFALADNYDATLTFIPMSENGLALDNEFRYWGAIGNSEQRLKLDASLYRSDESISDEDNPRWRIGLQNAIRWNPNLTANIDWQQTSDANVFNDAPIARELTNATKATQMARIDYHQQGLHGYLLYSGYQPLINFANNYEKRPEVGVHYQQALPNEHLSGKLNWYFSSQATDFRLKTRELNRAEGLRWHNQSGIKYQLRQPYGQAQAQINGYYSDYRLEQNPIHNEPRLIPQLSLNGGLIFERALTFNHQTYRQTLEPSVQYLYTGYQRQNQLPLFDSALRSLDFSNLFSLNAYVGADRIADSNQVSAALTSRFIDQQGKSRLELALGQGYRLSESQVLIEDGFDGSQGASDIYSKVQFNFDKLRLYSTVAYAPKEQTVRASASRIRWQPDEKNALFASHIKQRQEALYASETIMLGGLSQLTPQWQFSLVGNYDTDLQQWVETQVGIRYDSCCWSTTMIAERTQLENDLYNDSIQIQFELKGLSSPNKALQKQLNNLFNF